LIEIIDGKPVDVPDNDRITSEMKIAREQINTFLSWLSERGAQVQAIDDAYRNGKLSEVAGLDWYCDPDFEKEKP